MKAIDVLVAERVMGIVRKNVRIMGGGENNRVWCWSPVADGAYTRRELESQWGSPIPYSTSIADAWTVVEKMKMPSRIAVGRGGSVVVSFYDLGNTRIEEHESPCMAICIAGLRTVGVSQAEIDAALEAKE